jgi:hypothetical protein
MNMSMIVTLGSVYFAAFTAATPLAVPHVRGQRLADWALNRMQELNLQQLEALYSLLDDDGNGKLTVHEMIDLFDGINNDALLIEDCAGNPMPHHCKYCCNITGIVNKTHVLVLQRRLVNPPPQGLVTATAMMGLTSTTEKETVRKRLPPAAAQIKLTLTMLWIAYWQLTATFSCATMAIVGTPAQL